MKGYVDRTEFAVPRAGLRPQLDEISADSSKAASIAYLQRAVGNAAVARLLAGLPDTHGGVATSGSLHLSPSGADASPASAQPAPAQADYDRVHDEYWKLIVEITRVNGKVVSVIRTDWTEDLSGLLTRLSSPGTADAVAIRDLGQEFALTRKSIEQNVESARAEWKSLWAEYKTEREKYVDGGGWEARAIGFLDRRAKEDQDRVFKAWQYLTFDDFAGLESMVVNKTHERWATNQDQREEDARKRAEMAKLPRFRQFRMRALAGGQFSAGPVGADLTSFEIEEIGDRGRSGILTFDAVGLAWGFEAGAIGPQTWTAFSTTDPMRIEDFGVLGRMTSAGGYIVYGGGYSYLTFYVPGKRDVTIKSAGHGWGFGGGVSSVVGKWIVRSVDK